MAQKLNKTNFKETINSTEPVLVKFSSNWCNPCKLVGKLLDEMQNTLPKTYEVDVDENMELAEKYNVMAVPALIVFKEGKVKTTASGVQTKSAIMSMLRI